MQDKKQKHDGQQYDKYKKKYNLEDIAPFFRRQNAVLCRNSGNAVQWDNNPITDLYIIFNKSNYAGPHYFRSFCSVEGYQHSFVQLISI
jgi:hypothetical protein